MLSGRRAFHGESAADTMSAILKEEPPDLSDTNQNVSPALARLVNHCLEKNPEARFHSASDLAFALEAVSASSASNQTITALTALSPRERIRKYSPWFVAGLLGLALLAALPFVFLYFRRPSAPPVVAVRFFLSAPGKTDYLGGPIVSPDGRLVVFGARDASGKESLWVRPLASLEAHPIVCTEGSAGSPFWSPDSRSIGFWSAGKLKRIDIAGGPVQTICDAAFAGAAWGRDGIIVFGTGTGGGLSSIPATGGTPTQLTTLDKSRNENFHVHPYFLPDGRHFLFLARSAQEEKSAIVVGSLDSKERKFLVNADSSMAYAPPGYLIFARQQTLMAQVFNADTLKVSGEPFPIADRVGRTLATAQAYFSVSETGVLVYRSLGRDDSQLTWFDRSGRKLSTIGEPGIYAGIGLSPDEKRVALQKIDDEKGTYDIYLIELPRGIPSRLTFDPAADVYPVWSPDGTRIPFTSNRSGTANLYQKLSSGAGNDEILFESAAAKLSLDWSPDGRYLLYQAGIQQNFDLWVLPLFGERKPEIFLQTDFAEMYGRFSPDGRWVAYVSNASGKREVYVRGFPAPAGPWQISNGGGTQPRWRHDGRELFYLSPDKRIVAVDVDGSSGTFQAGIHTTLFDVRLGGLNGVSDYEVADNGQRFLANMVVEQNAAPATVVMNWTADLKR
jgi:Tol biopolymer transport system component